MHIWVKPIYLTFNLRESLRFSLRPIIPDNACGLRITAPAGTKLGATYSYTVHIYLYIKGVYNPKTFFLHAVLLDQTFVHCPKFPIAAFRRSTGRVSVPFCVVILSDHIPVVGLVSHYLTNYLIGFELFPKRLAALNLSSHPVLLTLSDDYSELRGTFSNITQPSAADQNMYCYISVTARLAYIRHTASVNPEPGSNSSLD